MSARVLAFCPCGEVGRVVTVPSFLYRATVLDEPTVTRPLCTSCEADWRADVAEETDAAAGWCRGYGYPTVDYPDGDDVPDGAQAWHATRPAPVGRAR